MGTIEAGRNTRQPADGIRTAVPVGKTKGRRRKKVRRKPGAVPFTRLADDARLEQRDDGGARVRLRLPSGEWKDRRVDALPYLDADGQVSDLAVQRAHEIARELRLLGGLSTTKQRDTIAKLVPSHLAWIESTYPKQRAHARICMGFLVEHFGHVHADEFGPLKLLEFRAIALGSGRWNRRTVVDYTARVVRLFRWSVGRELVDAARLVALESVEPLPHDQGEPSREVLPVAEDVFRKTLPHLAAPVSALLGAMWWTGARCGEVCIMRPMDVDRSSDPWIFRPSTHKTKHKNKKREIALGPQAQRVLASWLDRPAASFCFRPAEAEEARLAARTASRKTKAGVGHVADPEARANLLGALAPCYTTGIVAQAIERACAKAKVDRWTPHQVRHAHAQRTRDAGFDYAQLDRARAAKVAKALG
jgi:integrase